MEADTYGAQENATHWSGMIGLVARQVPSIILLDQQEGCKKERLYLGTQNSIVLGYY